MPASTKPTHPSTLLTRQELWILGVDEVGEITAVVQNHVERPILEVQSLLNAPQVLLICFTLPGIHWRVNGTSVSASPLEPALGNYLGRAKTISFLIPMPSHPSPSQNSAVIRTQLGATET